MGRLLLLLLPVLAVAGGAYWWLEKSPKVQPKDEIRTGLVTRGDLVQRVNISGFIVPKRKSVITSNFSGYVKKIFVEVGQEVKAGDPIVTVTQAAGSGVDDSFPLRAPFAGRVVQILKTEGEYVLNQSGNGLVRIDDLANLFVQSNAPEVDFPKLKVGLDVLLKPASLPGKAFKGKIVSIFQAAKDQENWERSRVEFPIKIEVLNENDTLKPGMTVVIDVITAEAKNVLLLAHEFLQREGEKYFVTTAEGSRIEVQVGLQNEEAFEAKSGVSEGMRLRQVDFASVAKDR